MKSKISVLLSVISAVMETVRRIWTRILCLPSAAAAAAEREEWSDQGQKWVETKVVACHSHRSKNADVFISYSTSRSGWRFDRDMGLMNAIGLQPRQAAPSVTSQGTQTPVVRLQNAETQTERELPSNSTFQNAHTSRYSKTFVQM